jgi:hypothetical protein
LFDLQDTPQIPSLRKTPVQTQIQANFFYALIGIIFIEPAAWAAEATSNMASSATSNLIKLA